MLWNQSLNCHYALRAFIKSDTFYFKSTFCKWLLPIGFGYNEIPFKANHIQGWHMLLFNLLSVLKVLQKWYYKYEFALLWAIMQPWVSNCRLSKASYFLHSCPLDTYCFTITFQTRESCLGHISHQNQRKKIKLFALKIKPICFIL